MENVFLKKCIHDCLKLPSYHADVNAMELIWATVKGYTARSNATLEIADMLLKSTRDGIATASKDYLISCCKHVEELKNTYWQADIAVEKEI